MKTQTQVPGLGTQVKIQAKSRFPNRSLGCYCLLSRALRKKGDKTNNNPEPGFRTGSKSSLETRFKPGFKSRFPWFESLCAPFLPAIARVGWKVN